ncbi:hypothetical protein KAT08_03090 [Candidatus Babeliales bacterium]|nr:hypothetical protein [Candidatus Babeliales bacterium]
MVRKVALSLTAAALLVGAVSGKTYSDKTFLMPRSQLSNIPLEHTIWHKNLHRKADSRYNGTIQVVPFYQESEDKKNIGKYFGFYWAEDTANDITAGIVNEIGVSPAGTAEKRLFRGNQIIHSHTAVVPLRANYKFEPDQKIYGARLFYHQDLDRILNGLFLRFNAPIVDVKNDMNITSLCTEVKSRLSEGNAIAIAGKEYGFLDYLSGDIENLDDEGNRQEPLRYAKITGGSHSASGIADVEATLGYTFWHKGRLRATLMGSLIIPTGSTPNGHYIFEPVYGNGHHWGITVNLDESCILWKRENKYVELSFVAKYKYLFESVEKRTLGIKSEDIPLTNFSSSGAAYRYVLGGESGQQKVFPLANVLTQDLRVSPGSQYESTINLSLVCKKFTLDIGYDFYAKEKEHVALKYLWNDDTYGVANVAYNTTDANGFNLTNGDHSLLTINEENLDFEPVITPDQITSKVYAAIGYECDRWQYPVMFGLGGSYEVSKNNSALENWTLWGKLGISW